MARLHTVGHIGDPATVGKCECSAVGTGQARESTIVRPRERYSLKISSLSSGVRQGVAMRPFNAATDGTPYYWQIPIYIVTRPSAQNEIIGFANSTTMTPASDLNVRLLSTGELELRDNTTVLHTTAVLSLNEWHVVDIKVQRDAGTPGAGADLVTLLVDGVGVFTSSAQSLGGISSMIVGANLLAEAQTQGEWYFGRLAVNDSSGSADFSYPSLSERVTYLHPNGTGTFDEPTATGAATNWEATDENAPDNTTTFANQATNSASWSAAGSRLMMTCQSAADGGIGPKDTINHISVGVVFSCFTATAAATVPGLRSGGSTVDVGTAKTIAQTTDAFLDDALQAYAPQYTDPAAAPWTAEKLDSLEIGARGTDTNPDVQLTTVWAMVAFEPRPTTLTDWPTPRRPRVLPSAPTANLLTSTLAVVQAEDLPPGRASVVLPTPAPFPRPSKVTTRPSNDPEVPLRPSAWPSPQRPLARPVDRPGGNLNLLGAAPEQAPLQSSTWPVQAPAWRRPATATGANLLPLTTEAAGAPFQAFSWPLPTRAPWRTPGATETRPSNDPQVPFFQALAVLPTPARVIRPPVATRNLPLYEAVVAAAPFSPARWPIPQRGIRGPAEGFLGSAILLEEFPIVPPTLWPLPARSHRLPPSVMHARPSFYTEPAGTPFVGVALPTPAPAFRRPPTLTHARPSFYVEPPGGTPTFGAVQVMPVWRRVPAAGPIGSTWQLDAIIPFVPPVWGALERPWPRPARVAVNTLGLLTAPPETLPFRQTHWPTPWRRPNLAHLLVPQNGAGRMDAPAQPMPFQQTHWPLPWRRPTTVHLLVNPNGTASVITPPAAGDPFVPMPWPLPRPYITPSAMRSFLQPRPSFYTEPGTPVGGPVDWRLPARAVRGVAPGPGGGGSGSFPPLLTSSDVEGHNNMPPYITVYFWRRVG